MATFTLTTAQALAKGSLTGVNVDPMVYFDWDIKALASGAALSDIIETPAIDLVATAPKCNRVVFQKSLNVASTDTVVLLGSDDGVYFYQLPLFNGGTGGGTAVSAVSAAEVGLVGLPSMRYVKGRITLGTAMSGLTVARMAIGMMRF